MTIILLGWIVAVAGVSAVIARRWKNSAARAPLPIVLWAVAAIWVVGSGAVSYQRLIAQGSWTAATALSRCRPQNAMSLIPAFS